ncbi:MAG: serine--tRNA ligase, partial [bacterium]|nr:serine--tRNA ligase [bacterium]
MIDIKLIRENPEAIKKAAESKNIHINTDHVLEIDQKYRELSSLVQTLREERNKYAKERNIEKGKGIKEKLEKEEKALLAVKEELDRELLRIPNPPKSDVKIGKNESENEIIRKYKEPTKLDFKPRDHLELGELLNIIDIKRAAKVSGARFDYLINEGALLEFALKQFAFDVLTKEGFIPV